MVIDAFLNFFTLCFYSIIFSFQTKPIINKTKKDLSYARDSHWRCSAGKGVFKNLENFTKITHLCWCLFLLKLHAFRHVVQKMLCFSFCWVFLYQQNRFVIFSLISYPSIESVAKSLTCFFFLSYFNKLFAPNIWKVLT